MNKKIAVLICAFLYVCSLSSCGKVDSVLDTISSVINIISFIRGCASKSEHETYEITIKLESKPKPPKMLLADIYNNNVIIANMKSGESKLLKIPFAYPEHHVLRIEMEGYETVTRHINTQNKAPQRFHIVLEKIAAENNISCRQIEILNEKYSSRWWKEKKDRNYVLLNGVFFTLVNSSSSDLYDVNIFPLAIFSDGYKAGLKKIFVGNWEAGKPLDINKIYNRFPVRESIEKYIFEFKSSKRKSKFAVYNVSNQCDYKKIILKTGDADDDELTYLRSNYINYNQKRNPSFAHEWYLFLEHIIKIL